MSQKLIVVAALLGSSMLLSSCAAKKKLAAAETEIGQLKATNSELVKKNDDLQKQVADFTASRQAALQEFEKYRAECEEAKQKLAAVKMMVTDQYNTLQEVEKKIDAALADFEGKGVEVYYKDGLVYVDMQDNLLYKSGSSSLGADGKKALGQLASALNNYPKLKVIVVGNTDDKVFKKGASDNWSLSTERANGVVRILRDEYNVDPVRLTAAGKSKYAPVADNTTEEGRAKNRRTAIILNPDLDRIWESVQQQQ